VVPETIAHYGILRRLGAGGIGEVYLASDLILDRQVGVRYGWRDEQWWRTDPQLAALRDTGALDSLFASLPALPPLVWR